jgi:hypothetical protein
MKYSSHRKYRNLISEKEEEIQTKKRRFNMLQKGSKIFKSIFKNFWNKK